MNPVDAVLLGLFATSFIALLVVMYWAKANVVTTIRYYQDIRAMMFIWLCSLGLYSIWHIWAFIINYVVFGG